MLTGPVACETAAVAAALLAAVELAVTGRPTWRFRVLLAAGCGLVLVGLAAAVA